VGVLLAAGSGIPWGMASIVIISVWLAAAGSGALNSYLDRDIDEVMYRTSRRPLPLGRIRPAEKALYAGILLAIIGLIISAVWLNLLATLFIALGAAVYIFVYTMWLKRKTPWSIVIGGLAGSCALLAGWFSVTTSFSLPPLLFSIFIFLWTPGHFWGLAIMTKDDSERASIPNLPTIYGERVTAQWAALANIALVPFSIIPYVLGILSEVYLFISVIVGLIVLVANTKLYFAPTAQRAWTVFKLSSPYLAIVYIAVAIDILLM
jgi:protoheme IX farnesyltransferase